MLPLCVSFRSSTEKVLNNNIRSILCDRVLYSRHQSVLQSSDLTRRNLMWIILKGLKAQSWTLSNTIIAIILFCFSNFLLQWHALDRQEQAKYYEMARKERALHMQLYPGWSARDNYAQQGKKKKRKRDKSQGKEI